MSDEVNRGKVNLESKDFIVQALTWQDSLLQSYRNYLVVTQSIFVTSAVVLFQSQLSELQFSSKAYFVIILYAIILMGLWTLFHLNGAIKERGRSVDWWQKQLMKAEASAVAQFTFTNFIIAKGHDFVPPQIDADGLERNEIETLMRSGSPKARKVFSVFVPGFALVWLVLLALSLYDVYQVLEISVP